MNFSASDETELEEYVAEVNKNRGANEAIRA